MVFDKRLFLFLFVIILFSTVAGILFHESGHWLAYRCYGYEARLRYASTKMLLANETLRDHHLIQLEYANKIDSNVDFPLKNEYAVLGKKLHKEDIIITAAGPFFTMLSAVSGMIVLFLYRKKRNDNGGLFLKQWLFVCIALFCIRGIVSLRTTITAMFLGTSYGYSDETKLARLFGWPEWSLPLFSELTAVVILLLLQFRIVPKKQRLTFFTALLCGELAVVYFWLILLGPKLMP